MAIDKKLIDQLLTDYKKPEDILGLLVVGEQGESHSRKGVRLPEKRGGLLAR